MDRILEIRKLYGQIVGLVNSFQHPIHNVHAHYLGDYRKILTRLSPLCDDDLSNFSADDIRSWSPGRDNVYWCDGGVVYSRLLQLKSFLEFGYNINDKIVEIGSLYNSIKDSELRERCGDLLTAPGHFDRVVAQATQILEQRIRERAGLDRSVYGAAVVNQAINPEPEKSILIVSSIKSEQEGFANICRGLLQFMRNETHHQISSDYSREDAFAICGFIDRVLRTIERSQTMIR